MYIFLQEALEPLCRLPFKEIRKLLSLVEKQIDWESLEVQVLLYSNLISTFRSMNISSRRPDLLSRVSWNSFRLKNGLYSQHKCPLGVSVYVSAFLPNVQWMACEVEKWIWVKAFWKKAQHNFFAESLYKMSTVTSLT